LPTEQIAEADRWRGGLAPPFYGQYFDLLPKIGNFVKKENNG
jgi:hypothetical protein